MNDAQPTEKQNPDHAPNGTDAKTNGFSGHTPGVDEKPKSRKKLKKEAKRRQAWLERFPPSPISLDATKAVEVDEAAVGLAPISPRRLREWYGIAARTLDQMQIIAAQKSNTLITANALMLAAAGLCVSRVEVGSIVGWALVPLALTNVLSLGFAIASAQVRQTTTLDELWQMPDDAYEHALMQIVGDKQHLLGSLRRDLHRAGANLTARQKLLHTAYNVLLGGVPLAALMFVLCIAAAARAQ